MSSMSKEVVIECGEEKLKAMGGWEGGGGRSEMSGGAQ